MFKNKILVKATLASHSSSSPLFLLPLSLHLPDSDPSLSIKLETLCWKLSRKWRLACLPQPSQILLVYRKSQLDSVDHVVSEFIKLAPSIHVGIEEEVKSGELTAKAIEFGLKCLMLSNKWSCIGDCTFIESSFDINEEKTNLCALNVQVLSGAYDEFVFVVSPDTLRFSRPKVSDLLNSENMDIFENNKEVIFERYDFSTACMTLPFLYEGYIRGLSKVLPEGECFDMIQDLWSVKNGLTLQSSYFIAVQYSNGGCMNKQWLPSSFVLKSTGITAVPKTKRGSNANLAYESFKKILLAWDLFGGGPSIVTEQSIIRNGCSIPAWEKAAENWETNSIICENLLSALDFRTSKPDFGYTPTPENNILEHSGNKDNVFLSDGDSNSKDALKNNTPAAEICMLPDLKHGSWHWLTRTRHIMHVYQNCTIHIEFSPNRIFCKENR